MKQLFFIALGLLCGLFARAEVRVTDLDVAPVWAGHRVGFCLLTAPPRQYVAYYDANRQMTVAMRLLDETTWTYHVLPEQVVWDSHNYITMVLDDTGRLHLAGNMHVHPLKYFRTQEAHDIATFERIERMVGTEEDRCTYPAFLRGPSNELIFTYRDGKSGSGNQIYNVYSVETQSWSRLLDAPLVDGNGEANAYFDGPVRGPDGYFHLCWVWRDTPDCATNHDLSYARSKDLRRWENSRGEALELPIRLETADIADPVPPGGGIINGNARIGFDLLNRPVLSYHKYDEAGTTQIYNARFEEGAWKIYQATQWNYRWDFSGGGSIVFEVGVGPVVAEGGQLYQSWSQVKEGSQRWRLDPESLKPVEPAPSNKLKLPAKYTSIASTFPGMGIQTATDRGDSGTPGVTYQLRWETLGPNRDKPRPEPWPEPSMLRVLRIETSGRTSQ
ncbi:MAG: hypothetical protein AMXMBFR84_00270 [Candidatus Hydrogenedentota bacterium]